MSKTHGMSYTRLYAIYKDMIRRCHNPKDKRQTGYVKYGAKGIEVCKEWRENRVSFFEWAISNGYEDNLSLDREDSYKGYDPENCRWTDKTTQSRNTPKHKVGISGIRGVSYCKTTNGWRATISINNRSITIGRAKTINEAAKLRNKYIEDNNLDHIKSEVKDAQEV